MYFLAHLLKLSSFDEILGYQIEKRYPKGEWKVASTSLVPGTKTTLKNVDEGMTYEFRVCAVNDGGCGKYSSTLGPHLVKDPICKLNKMTL